MSGRSWSARKNILTHRSPQWNFALRCVVLVVVGQMLLVGAVYAYLDHVVRIVTTEYSLTDVLAAEIAREMHRGIVLVSAWVFVINLVLGVWFGLKVSHRFYGVLVPITRLMGKLGDGAYGDQVKLRAGDELEDLRDAVNALSRRLQQRYPGDS